MKARGGIFLSAAMFVLGIEGQAPAAEPRFRLDGGLTFSRFEQQVKTEVGGERGERLVEELQFGYAQALTYRIWGPFAAGGFLQADVGQRRAARFSGFDATGKTVTAGEVGGSYAELWMGPIVRVEWRRVFGEIGYALYGARRDSGRDDLASESGDRTGTLYTSATVAWAFAVGGRIPLVPEAGLDLVLRLQFRIRYYDSRRGEDLAGGIVHGTQNFSPFVGVAWSFGPR